MSELRIANFIDLAKYIDQSKSDGILLILSTKMLQWFKSTLFSILFNIIFGEPPLKYPLKEQVEFNPAIYNTDLPSGVKYLVKVQVDSCKQRALVEQKVTFHYILLLYDGKNLTHSGTSRTTKPVTNVLSITGKIPIGKSWQ